MCDIMDKLYNEAMARGEKRGEKRGVKIGEMKTKRETALAFAEMGLPVEQIAYGLRESSDLVKKWLAEGLPEI